MFPARLPSGKRGNEEYIFIITCGRLEPIASPAKFMLKLDWIFSITSRSRSMKFRVSQVLSGLHFFGGRWGVESQRRWPSGLISPPKESFLNFGGTLVEY